MYLHNTLCNNPITLVGYCTQVIYVCDYLSALKSLGFILFGVKDVPLQELLLCSLDVTLEL